MYRSRHITIVRSNRLPFEYVFTDFHQWYGTATYVLAQWYYQFVWNRDVADRCQSGLNLIW